MNREAMRAYCSKLLGSASIVAPASMRHAGFPLVVGSIPQSAGPVDAADPSEHQERRGHRRPGIPCADDRLRVAALHERRRDPDRRVAAPAERVRRMLVHLDDITGVDDGDARPGRRPERGPDDLVTADEHDLRDAALRPVQQRAPNDLVRGRGHHPSRRPRCASAQVLLGVRFLERILITCRPRYIPQCGQA